MYLDKLDGKIEGPLFDSLSVDWRKQQDRCLREIERLQSADQSYLEEGITIFEMAQNAQRLFENEQPMEKRRLLNFVVSELDVGRRRAESYTPRTIWIYCKNGEGHFGRRFRKRSKLC